MLTKTHDKSEVFIFGSALHSSTPKDIDILIIYAPEICPPIQAYDLHSEFLDTLSNHFNNAIHATLLTKSEEIGTSFIERTGAIKLSSFLMTQGIQFDHFYQMLP